MEEEPRIATAPRPGARITVARNAAATNGVAPHLAVVLREPPAPLHGGPLTLLAFMRANHMLKLGYLRLLIRLGVAKLRYRGRLQTDGICFICPGVRLEIGRTATLRLGRWSWIGRDSKVRVHEGEVSIGAKSVLGEQCTLYAFQNISIGRECLIADRSMMIDFDHGASEVDRPVRAQGIYKRDVVIGHNVWMGYASSVLRGVHVGDNAIIGTASVVTRDVPANAVVAGAPARIVRVRDAPATMRWR